MSSSDEKVGVENVEAAGDHSSIPVSANDFDFSPAKQKKIIRHIDRRLVATAGVLYCVSLVDRLNMGAANIAGMAKELVLTGNRYVSSTRRFLSDLEKGYSVLIDSVLWLLEYGLARLLRHLHHLSASVDRYCAEAWYSAPHGSAYRLLGRLCTWNGLCQGLAANDCAESCAWSLRGWYVSFPMPLFCLP